MPLTRNRHIRRLHSSEVRPPTIPCSFPGCRRSFINNSGLTHHIRKHHSRLRHHSSVSPISPPSSPPVVSPVRRRVRSYSSPSEISSPGDPNATPLNSPNITVTPLSFSSPNITPLNSPILPIDSPFDFEFPSSPPVQDGLSIDDHDGGHDADQHLPAGLPPNPDQGHENPVLSQLTKTRHSIIDGTEACSIDLCNQLTVFILILGRPCDEDGNFLPPNTPPSPRRPHTDPEDWTPYESRLQFETAEFLFTRNQMSAGHIDTLLNLWAASLLKHGDEPPFSNHTELYDTIDSTPLGDVPWETFNLKYDGALPENEVPAWMTSEYDVWFRDPHSVLRNVLSNPDFDGEFDYAPYQEYDVSGNHRFQDLMSGNWAWKQAVRVLFDYYHFF
jgi:hypothetical protein